MTSISIEAAPLEPIFSVDLGSNGGIVAPKTVLELQEWIQREQAAWTWIGKAQAQGQHKGFIDTVIKSLRILNNTATHLLSAYQDGPNSAQYINAVEAAKSGVVDLYVKANWPHSSSPLYVKIRGLAEQDPTLAYGYLFAVLNPQQPQVLDVQYASAWRGFIQGVTEQRQPTDAVTAELKAQLESLDSLRARSEQTLGTKTAIYDALHRNYENLVGQITLRGTEQEQAFKLRLENAEDAHRKALEAHQAQMSALEDAFREKMTLRGPVDYWKQKANSHSTSAQALLKWVFGSLGLLALVICALAFWTFSTLQDGKPEAWKVATMVLLAVVAVWAVRLIIRMWLSHTHLATDAEERVTMVQTYLALLESQKVPSDEDRKLILAPLFRPASDGLVKDEGVPHPMLELFTKGTSR